ncbi:Gas vesicle protein K [Halobacillus karajensis]|uniref:Gas vesicle protein K n=1 Tax=Halobacillus karajensis TaxID=195088 RepID=A0A024P2N9_9BACI|nr:gas vesicle protein K [Halobacillus karajensis]CDQ19173.1 Gas vesicle protein K [Halobacillus karajensis]CDQ22753.1 Gas vesicle protein K [Halobacillus karajensis]CDQ26235.1 Gas vesicle protein K [Halobacillus karajensis]SEH40555.1 Gas vesicle protein K [Halobacillus karajensis]
MSQKSIEEQPFKSSRINLDPDGAEQGLAQLVLTIIELLRELVERQAIRRVDGGTLTEEQMEQLGVALMNLEVKMDELKEIFELDDDDLNIDLGPLGNLL